MDISNNTRILVIGLGYVGLPLAIAFARNFHCTGIDIDPTRITELQDGFDRTNEVDSSELQRSDLAYSDDFDTVDDADIIIVTVPTPVNDDHTPNLDPLIEATKSVAGVVARNEGPAIIVYESTVYPGVTEDVCGPLLEKIAGKTRGSDIFLGYSPERINPGDKTHSLEQIVKVIAGENDEITDALEALYGTVTQAGCFRAKSIKAAEAAKVIENAQRDINIAFVNEITQVFSAAGLSIWDVLEVSRTKWNFMDFQPGLVGGHCIGVDPYYLSHYAEKLGCSPNVILSGRSRNDAMGNWVVSSIVDECSLEPGAVLLMGLTFKRDVPDLRNSKVVDVHNEFRARGFEVSLHDPLADADEVTEIFGSAPDSNALGKSYDLVLCLVDHQEYEAMAKEEITALVNGNGVLGDLKGIWKDHVFPDSLKTWTL
jgi:UDP-N-acetyl-D-galactosamine dehydrogenase